MANNRAAKSGFAAEAQRKVSPQHQYFVFCRLITAHVVEFRQQTVALSVPVLCKWVA